jgi:hypothetical protein
MTNPKIGIVQHVCADDPITKIARRPRDTSSHTNEWQMSQYELRQDQILDESAFLEAANTHALD